MLLEVESAMATLLLRHVLLAHARSTIRVEPWGASSVRIRWVVGSDPIVDGLPGALAASPQPSSSSSSSSSSSFNTMTSGNLRIATNSAEETIVVTRISDGVELVRQLAPVRELPCDAQYNSSDGCETRTTLRLRSDPRSAFYGTGQKMNTHGVAGRLPAHLIGDTEMPPSLDMAGGRWDFESCTDYTQSSGAEICLPWILGAIPNESTYSFGVLWNMPNFGKMELGGGGGSRLERGEHEWTAHDAAHHQIDLWITTFETGSAKGKIDAAQQLLKHFVDAVGHVPVAPAWLSGYWHSPFGGGRPFDQAGKKVSFNQSVMLASVEGLAARNITPSVFVVDFMSWTHMGDFTFNPKWWPTPKVFIASLRDKGTRVMVSSWPFVDDVGARASAGLNAGDFAVKFGTNGSAVPWPDTVCDARCALYDASSQAARDYVFRQIESGWIQDGVESFWFDASEPENLGGTPRTSRYAAGNATQVGMLFPVWHARMAFDGLKRVKGADFTPVTLSRSGWVGIQKFGAVVWNGDLGATWANLKKTISAGLGAQLSGLGWWSHDIGAIGGGAAGVICNISDVKYRELLLRWFAYGVTSPVFRQHGNRPIDPWALLEFGASGKMAYGAVLRFIALRETLRPYVQSLLARVAATGEPVNTPLSWNFPSDQVAWGVDDQLMLGDRYMAAPVHVPGATSRRVYFPRGRGTAKCAQWRPFAAAIRDTTVHHAGTWATVSVALDELALFECVQSKQNSATARAASRFSVMTVPALRMV